MSNQNSPDTGAAVLSLFVPGLGQIVQGRVVHGLVWLLATYVGYLLFIVPGLIVHIFCILNAAKRPQE